MGKINILVGLLLVASIGLTQNTVEFGWDGQTERVVDTLTFQFPITATCVGNCGEKFQLYFTTSESLNEINKAEHTCYQQTCSFNPTFEVKRWTNWEAWLTVKATSDPEFDETAMDWVYGVDVRLPKITFDRKPGIMTGTIKKINGQAEVTFECKDALCMGVKLGVTGSDQEIDCEEKDMDANSPSCKAIFSLTGLNGQIYGTAKTVIPKNTTFQSDNFLRVGEESVTETPTEVPETELPIEQMPEITQEGVLVIPEEDFPPPSFFDIFTEVDIGQMFNAWFGWIFNLFQ